MHETTIKGPAGELAVIDFGSDGPDMVLLHGAGRTVLDWLPMVERLEGVRCVGYDLRGHGRSEPPGDGDYGWLAHLADLEAVVAALRLEAPVVAGHSLGGDIALECGVRASAGGSPRASAGGSPRACRAVVDIDGFGGAHPRLYPGFDPDEVKRRRRAQTEAMVGVLGEERVSEEVARGSVERAAAAASAIGVEREERAAWRSLVPDGKGGYLRRLVPAHHHKLAEVLEDWDAFELLDVISVPTLAIHGTRRPDLSAAPPDVRAFMSTVMGTIDADLAALAERNPQVRVELIDGAGHMVHLEAAEQVARSVSAFVMGL